MKKAKRPPAPKPEYGDVRAYVDQGVKVEGDGMVRKRKRTDSTRPPGMQEILEHVPRPSIISATLIRITARIPYSSQPNLIPVE